MNRLPRKGDHLKYVGEYSPTVLESAKYPPGVVIGFRDYKRLVTVKLDGSEFFADWPVDKVELA